ncbi:hypothetical protein OIU77_007621 [Salix suchowensis]|uniref:Uncharacterized protein n=1 Tax=Salix suchowensis TaxID=1278906 RepID=A0ABQ9AHQ3_9ROSI|nr:hypothetical protein OIU77_007621 [Salix suchowensis]
MCRYTCDINQNQSTALSVSAMMTMDRRFSRESSRESKGSIALQKKIVDSQRPHTAKNVPDLTDFMNDMFFGTMDDDKKACNLTGCHSEDEEESFDDSTRSSSSELPEEWLDAARRCHQPLHLIGGIHSPGLLEGTDQWRNTSQIGKT